MAKHAPIILISGPPGAGKTTVARCLVDGALAPRAVHLHGDDFWRIIRKGFIPPHLPESKAQNEVVMRAVADVALRFAQADYEVIVDFVVGPWHVEVFREAARTAGVALAYVVLLPSEVECAKRAAAREEGPIADYEPLSRLYSAFAAAAELESHLLRDPESAADTARSIRLGLAEGKYALR